MGNLMRTHTCHHSSNTTARTSADAVANEITLFAVARSSSKSSRHMARTQLKLLTATLHL
jgi:hypothetical protein